MKTFLQTILLIVAIFILALIAESIPPLKQLTNFLNEHPQPYKGITIGAAIAGWVLMAGVVAYGLWTRGRSMTNDEALRFMENSASSPTIHRHFRGRAKGRDFYIEITFKEIKQAWLSGDWQREPKWLMIFIGLLAIALIAFGMFGFFFVIGPPLVKLLCSGALLYAMVRTTLAFWKA
jgi:hypothetical protein